MALLGSFSLSPSAAQVLSTKKVLYLVNMTARDYLRSNSAQHPAVLAVQQSVEMQSGESGKDPEVFPVSLAFEENLRRIELQEGPEALSTYYQANPTHVSAIGTILREVHRALGIIHFYTMDERMVRCWCVKQGRNIQESAAVVDVNISRYICVCVCIMQYSVPVGRRGVVYGRQQGIHARRRRHSRTLLLHVLFFRLYGYGLSPI
jgi:ribosome-binding ATPase YchF (GTP1/OBG family)